MQPMIYEERRIIAKRGKADAYADLVRQSIKPAFEANGGEVIALVQGLIGAPIEEIIQVTRFPDLGHWQKAQETLSIGRMELIESEETRVMRSIASRPKPVIPAEDSRAVYGYRRFFIDPEDHDDFVRYSEEGIWPRIEWQGACILGLWSPIAATSPQEIVLMTGYHGPAHWEETRTIQARPTEYDESSWERIREMHTARRQLPLRSWVCLMRNIEI